MAPETDGALALVEQVGYASPVAFVGIPAPIGPAPLGTPDAEPLHEVAEIGQRRAGKPRRFPQEAAQVAEFMRRLAGRGAHVDREDRGIRDLPAGEALLRVGIAQPVALVEDDDRPDPFRSAVLGEFVVLGTHGLARAVVRARQQTLGTFVVGERHGLGREPGPGQRPPPRRNAAFRPHDEDLGFGHRRHGGPHREGLAEAGSIAQHETRPARPARRQDRVPGRTLMGAWQQRRRRSEARGCIAATRHASCPEGRHAPRDRAQSVNPWRVRRRIRRRSG